MPQNICSKVRVCEEISSQFSRSDLGHIWSILISEPTGIARYFEGFAIENRPKMA
jgi:hypothetical protein